MSDNTTEISSGGRWIRVPCLEVEDKVIVVGGRWIKKAEVRSEAWLETELEDPEACVERIKSFRGWPVRPDIFTFTQKLPESLRPYDYLMEQESVAAIRISTFKE